MRARRLIASTLLAIPAAPTACAPQPGRPPASIARPAPAEKRAPPRGPDLPGEGFRARRPALTEERAAEALKAMLRAHPEAFRMASVTVRPEESDRFLVDPAGDTYRISIASGACTFDYEGTFAFRDGSWQASEPELRSIAKHLR